MVKVRLLRGDRGLLGFTADGHTGFGYAGDDIVCAAVSALTTVTVLGLESRLRLEPEVEMDEEAGYLSCRLDPETTPAPLWERAQDLLETLALGLYEIERDYKDYIMVKEVRV